MKKRQNYLNNKDLLKEIHKSKLSYCYSVDDAYNHFDIIVDGVDEITPETVQQARENQAARLSSQAYERGVNAWYDIKGGKGVKPKQAEFRVEPDSIKDTDIVIRVMTFDHVPEEPGRKKNPKTVADRHARCNFPPFKHYALIDGEWKEVVRSHWEGGMGNGHFSVSHGKITNELAKMMMELCTRYSMRSNWRGYCVDEETEALTDQGWVNINSIDSTNKILSFDGSSLVWSNIKSVFKSDFNGLMHNISNNQGLNMLITPEHKLVTTTGLVKVEHILQSDKIVLMGDSLKSSTTEYTDDFVELVGWIITEGNYEYNNLGIKNIRIWQNEGEYAERIRNCLNSLEYKFSEKANNKNNICFLIHKSSAVDIHKYLPEKTLTSEFIFKISTLQRELLFETLIDADGWRTKTGLKRYTQKDIDHCNNFQLLCATLGLRSQLHYRNKMSFGKMTNYQEINVFSTKKNQTNGSCLNFNGGMISNKNAVGKGKQFHPNIPTKKYKGRVWCPETEYGCFVARRRGSVYLTGNTYVDEMRGNALVQLSQVGLQFNEARSQNPFAYYTATITNSFTRVLNLEKRNQNIRDDILQDEGYMPSFNRQLDDEAAQQKARAEDEEAERQKDELTKAGYNVI